MLAFAARFALGNNNFLIGVGRLTLMGKKTCTCTQAVTLHRCVYFGPDPPLYRRAVYSFPKK